MKGIKIFLLTCFMTMVAFVCSGFQETEEHIINHVYHTADGNINYVAEQYYKFSDPDVVGTLEDYQSLVRVYNRDLYNFQRPRLQAGDILKIPVRRHKK